MRLLLTMNIAWTVHGAFLHQLPIVLTNFLVLFTTVPIVALLAISANLGQTIELVRAPHVRGVSTGFTVLAVFYQSLWVAWGLLVPDAATIMAASTMFAMLAFNLLWYVLRRCGLRGFFSVAEPEVVVP